MTRKRPQASSGGWVDRLPAATTRTSIIPRCGQVRVPLRAGTRIRTHCTGYPSPFRGEGIPAEYIYYSTRASARDGGFMISDEKVGAVAASVAELYHAIKAENGGDPPAGAVPAITQSAEVTDRMTGLLFAVHQIGVTLDAVGDQPLVHRVVVAVEELLDDVLAHVFLNRRWDGYTRK